jgi:superfamily II DNA helicase RecQ
MAHASKSRSIRCLTCKTEMKNIFPQSNESGNCRNCGNFISLKPDRSIHSQALKEFPSLYQFRPEVNPQKVLTVQSRKAIFKKLSLTSQEFNPNAKYLKYRRKNVREIFQSAERFGFRNETVHHAVAIYDKFLQIEDCIDRLRSEYESCRGVISE